jgi:hypothetical protein
MKRFEKWETLTNIAYAISGLVGFFMFGNFLFALVMITLGVGSYWYHKFKTHPIYSFDRFGMALVLGSCMGMIVSTPLMWGIILSYLIFYGFFIMGKIGVTIEVAALAIPTLISSYIVNGWIISSIVLAIFVFALYIRTKDDGVSQVRFHDSWGHSLWHILTAIGFFLLIFGTEFI